MIARPLLRDNNRHAVAVVAAAGARRRPVVDVEGAETARGRARPAHSAHSRICTVLAQDGQKGKESSFG